MLEFSFVYSSLSAIDEVQHTELLVCTYWQDIRPMTGLAGLIDWRLNGEVSRLLRAGFAVGETTEALLVPGRPRAPFEKIIFVGAGERPAFNEQRYRATLADVMRVLEKLKASTVTLELPGRADTRIEPENAIAVALELAGESKAHAHWYVVDTPEAGQRMATEVEQRRKFQRRIL